jgi:prepilin-type N-terminal cleavage/methylation domain-containing protein
MAFACTLSEIASRASENRCARDGRSDGFTLLEMVAVLFVVGLTASIVIPRLPAIQASLDFALKRDTFEQAMNALPYSAFKANQDYVLLGTYDSHGQVDKAKLPEPDRIDEIPGQMRALPVVATNRVQMLPVLPVRMTPPLPDGWRLVVPEPIQYRASGYCTGGTADVEVGGETYTFKFEPPFCQIRLER